MPNSNFRCLTGCVALQFIKTGIELATEPLLTFSRAYFDQLTRLLFQVRPRGNGPFT